jgi:hypothetical protein
VTQVQGVYPDARRQTGGDAGEVDSSLQPIRIALELVPGAQPLSGRVSDGAGFDKEFIGWTGLAATLTLLLEQAESPDRETTDERSR